MTVRFSILAKRLVVAAGLGVLVIASQATSDGKGKIATVGASSSQSKPIISTALDAEAAGYLTGFKRMHPDSKLDYETVRVCYAYYERMCRTKLEAATAGFSSGFNK